MLHICWNERETQNGSSLNRARHDDMKKLSANKKRRYLSGVCLSNIEIEKWLLKEMWRAKLIERAREKEKDWEREGERCLQRCWRDQRDRLCVSWTGLRNGRLTFFSFVLFPCLLLNTQEEERVSSFFNRPIVHLNLAAIDSSFHVASLVCVQIYSIHTYFYVYVKYLYVVGSWSCWRTLSERERKRKADRGPSGRRGDLSITIILLFSSLRPPSSFTNSQRLSSSLSHTYMCTCISFTTTLCTHRDILE